MSYISAADSIQIFGLGLAKHVYNVIKCIMVVQGHPRSLFWYQSKAYCDQ